MWAAQSAKAVSWPPLVKMTDLRSSQRPPFKERASHKLVENATVRRAADAGALCKRVRVGVTTLRPAEDFRSIQREDNHERDENPLV